MADHRITNCHIHLFTLDHVPRDYPHPGVGFISERPGLITKLAAFTGRDAGTRVRT